MTARLFIAGDIVNSQHAAGEFCSPEVKAFISDADFAIANLEAPIAGYGSPVRKSGPLLAQQPGTIPGLRSLGFDAVALANNHIMDFGEDGLTATMHALDREGVRHLGAGTSRAKAYTPLVVTINGLRIALINACEAHHGVHDQFMPEATAGYAWLFGPEIPLAIQACAAECDATIVLAHAGLEHFQVPLLEWRDLYRWFCSLGASAVVGNHPHVPQGMERCGDSLIFYSLGNFYFDTNRYATTPDHTYSVVLTVDTAGRIEFEPFYSWKREGLVQAAPANPPASLDSLNRLLHEDYKTHLEAMVLKQFATLNPLLQRTLSPWGVPTNLRATIRYWGSRILGRNPAIDRACVLQHLLRNESYYFALRHAAALRVK